MHPYRSEQWEPEAAPMPRRGPGPFAAVLVALSAVVVGALAWFQWIYDPIAEDPHQLDARTLRLIAPLPEAASEPPVLYEQEAEPCVRVPTQYYYLTRDLQAVELDHCSCREIGCRASEVMWPTAREHEGWAGERQATLLEGEGAGEEHGAPHRRPGVRRR